MGPSWAVGWLPAQCSPSHVCSRIIRDPYRRWTVTSEPLLQNGMSFSELCVLDSKRIVCGSKLASWLAPSAVQSEPCFALGSFMIPIVGGQ